MAFSWIIRNSQESFLPAELDATYDITTINHVKCVRDCLDSRVFPSNQIPIIGNDKKLIQLLTFFSHIFKIPGASNEYYHRSKTATAGFLRNNSHGIFVTNSQKKVGKIITKSCFRCKRSGQTIQNTQISHHRLALKPPYSRLSIDILGPFTVKSAQKSRSMVKTWAILAVCLSTGLVTFQMTDQISHEAVIRALWCIQIRHSVTITHLHLDNGTQFRNLGD